MLAHCNPSFLAHFLLFYKACCLCLWKIRHKCLLLWILGCFQYKKRCFEPCLKLEVLNFWWHSIWWDVENFIPTYSISYAEPLSSFMHCTLHFLRFRTYLLKFECMKTISTAISELYLRFLFSKFPNCLRFLPNRRIQ